MKMEEPMCPRLTVLLDNHKSVYKLFLIRSKNQKDRSVAIKGDVRWSLVKMNTGGQSLWSLD